MLKVGEYFSVMALNATSPQVHSVWQFWPTDMSWSLSRRRGVILTSGRVTCQHPHSDCSHWKRQRPTEDITLGNSACLRCISAALHPVRSPDKASWAEMTCICGTLTPWSILVCSSAVITGHLMEIQKKIHSVEYFHATCRRWWYGTLSPSVNF